MQRVLLKQLKRSSLKNFPEKIRADLSVAAKVKSQVYRGIIQSYDSNSHICKVKLVDFGRVVDVSADDLTLLPKLLRQTNQFCICIKIFGIKPTGSGKEWTFSAIDRLNNLMYEKRLYVKSCVRFLLIHNFCFYNWMKK